MKRVRIALVGAVLGVSMLGSAAPAQASTCDESIEDACRVAGTVICKLLVKGQPCLM